MRKTRRLPLAAPLALAAAALAPGAALACGGFFRTETAIDQAAERVIFKQTSADTLEAFLDIRFQGDPSGFAWVLPVSGVPSAMEIVPASLFELLDEATAPVLLAPECLAENTSRGADAGFGAPGGGPIDGEPDPAEVTVLDRTVVGDYDIATLAATSGEALTQWLRQNGYRITDQMVPFVDLYLGQGLNFLAIKLVAGAGVDGIKPLKLAYKASAPMLPLRLASLAAEPEMGLEVFVLADQRYTPGNASELQIPAAALAWNVELGQSNWKAAVARAVDENGGQGMVVDFAGPAAPLAEHFAGGGGATFVEGEDQEATRAAMASLFQGARYVTRLYGRYSPEEMGVDLTFKAAPRLGDVAQFREIPADNCELSEDPCAFQACGMGGLCVLTTGPSGETLPACACVDGATARAVNDTAVPGSIRVSCVDVRMDLDPIRPPDGSTDVTVPPTPSLPDPCAADPCGEHGECFALNGQQTCLCERGFVAVAHHDAAGKLVAACRAPNDDVPDDFYRRTLPEPRLPFPGMGNAAQSVADDGCTQSPGGGDRRTWLWFLGLGGLPLLLRRKSGRKA